MMKANCALAKRPGCLGRVAVLANRKITRSCKSLAKVRDLQFVRLAKVVVTRYAMTTLDHDPDDLLTMPFQCNGHLPCNVCLQFEITCRYKPDETPLSKSLSSMTSPSYGPPSSNLATASGSLPQDGPAIPIPLTKNVNEQEAAGISGNVRDMLPLIADAHGSLIYIGDSAGHSFLELLRVMVERVSGPCRYGLPLLLHNPPPFLDP